MKLFFNVTLDHTRTTGKLRYTFYYFITLFEKHLQNSMDMQVFLRAFGKRSWLQIELTELSQLRCKGKISMLSLRL